MSKTLGSKEIFENMPVQQAVRVMAVPAVISQLIVLMYNLADTFFIGKTNDPYMVAGVSLLLPVFNVCLAMGALFGVGGGALLPKLLAAERRDEAEKANMFCIRVTLLIAAAFSIVMALFMEPILHLLGAGDNTYLYARQYTMLVIILGAVPTVMTNALANLLRSVSLSKQAGFGVALGGVLNIILDPLFMFVILPRGNEVLGVGIATLLSNVISCAYCLWVFIKGQNELRVSLRIRGVARSSVAEILIVGIPGAVGTLLFDLDYVVLDKLMSAYGDIPLAAIGIVLKAERIPQQVGIGLCQGIVPLVAYSYAQKNYKRMKDTILFTALVGLLVSLIGIAMYELFSPAIIRVIINEAETVAIGAQFLRVRAVAAMFMFLSFYVVHMYQAFGRGRTALILACVRWAGLNIPMLFLLNYLLGMLGLVWAQLVADIITTVMSYIVLGRFLRRL